MTDLWMRVSGVYGYIASTNEDIEKLRVDGVVMYGVFLFSLSDTRSNNIPFG